MKIILTGAAGFIGSCLLWRLNREGYDKILIVDHMENSPLKQKNIQSKKYTDYLDKHDFIKRVEKGQFKDYGMILHIGACSSTMGSDKSYYMKNNYGYTKKLAEFSLKNNIRFQYASSAATYGDGENGFSDEDAVTPGLKPLNLYGESKHLFDMWVLENKLQDKFVGYKFFNVYGPNEYHKKEMRSLICKRYYDVVRDKKIGLFKSYNPEYPDGGQKRDFIYIKDALDVVYYFIENPDKAGIFNVGTGRAHTWNELAEALFEAIGIPLNIEYIDMPEILKDKYQYFTEASTEKLRGAGYRKQFSPLKDVMKDYVSYLKNKSHL
jgi:ADP-L-glycero-D-manno-heptose 6-epimerase